VAFFINVLFMIAIISTNTFKWPVKINNLFIDFAQNNVNHFDLYFWFL
jgi:hypothetical protein